jgi:hypothetical protein
MAVWDEQQAISDWQLAVGPIAPAPEYDGDSGRQLWRRFRQRHLDAGNASASATYSGFKSIAISTGYLNLAGLSFGSLFKMFR